MNTYEPIEVAIALSLYDHNTNPNERAEKIYEHFEGRCAAVIDLCQKLYLWPGNATMALDFPAAEVYVQHALERYGEEARRTVQVNREFMER